jgi:hypothetical protein
VREVLEAKQGLSHARNAALAASSDADYIIYTDDDVEVSETWLSAYLEAFAMFPEAGYFAGPIDPGFCGSVPNWVTANLSKLAGSYGALDLGGELRELSVAESRLAPHGGNMAFRIGEVQGLQFDTCLGRTGEIMLMGEETRFVLEMMNHGSQGVWVPRARLTHLIPSEHISAKYVWKRFEGGGRSVARTEGRSIGPNWFGAPRYCWKRYLMARTKMALLAPVRSRAWFDAFADAAYLQGYISEQRRMNGNVEE